MPVTLEHVNSQVAHVERLNEQKPVPVREMLAAISNVLTDIRTIYAIFGQIEQLSGKRISLMEDKYPAVHSFFARLRPIVAQYIKNKEYNIVIGQIGRLLPSEAKEEEYIKMLAFPPDKAPIISRRIYIPQRFVGLVDVGAIKDLLAEIAFLTTAGLGPCVGYILFSKTTKCCALAHFDDLLNATAEEATEECKARAIQHYRVCAQKILDAITRFSDAAKKAQDWQVILTPSQDPSSHMLTELLQRAMAGIGDITAMHVNAKAEGYARNLLIELDGFLAEPAQLKLRSYQEVVQFADLPANLLTLKEVLHLPPTGFALYHIQEGALVPQDVNQPFSMVDNYVTPRPLTAGVAAITDRAVAALLPGGASAAAAAGVSAESVADDAAAEPQPREAASSSASGGGAG